MDGLSKVVVVGSLLACLAASPAAQAAGTPAPTSNPPTLDFGKHDVGACTAPVPVRIDNPTASELQFTAVSSLPDYAIDRSGCREPVPSGGWCTILVRFSPLAAGLRKGNISIGYPTGADGKWAVNVLMPLTGIGVAPELGVSPSRLWFPLRSSTGPDARQTIFLTNHAGHLLTIRSVTVSGEFAVATPGLPLQLPHGAILALRVWHRSAGHSGVGVVTILSDASENPQAISLTTTGPDQPYNFVVNSPGIDLLFALFLCLGYWLAMVAARWHRVAMATRGDLRGEIDAVRAELDAMAPAAGNASAQAAADLLRKAGDLLDGPKDKSGNRVLNILFWSRGQEINGWGYVHEAQIRMVPLMDDPTLRARLETTEPRLRLANDACSTSLADAIHTALTTNPAPDTNRMKALLMQALAMKYHLEDNVFSDLVSWQNKTSWLVLCGLCAIVALTAIFPEQAVLLLVGAAGGLISRLSRSLDRKDVPTDYGASWTTLFLSPVAGAVGAWAGIMIAALAVKANVLGAIFRTDWAHPGGVGTLGVALLFGFSERLLDSVLDKLEGQTAAAAGAQSTLAILDPKLADGTVGTPYLAQLQATGATGNVLWSVAQGSTRPDGLSLDGTGKISGTPTRAATFSFVVEAVDQKTKATRTLTLKIA